MALLLAGLEAVAVQQPARGRECRGRRRESRPRPDRADETGLVTGDDDRLVCAWCRHTVTDRQQRIEVDGRHAHYFTNPHGLVFHIGCYRAAPGCTAVGEPTAEWTWFAGYRWRIALCANCGAHLGWRYQGGEPGSFFGLIADRIAGQTGHPDH